MTNRYRPRPTEINAIQWTDNNAEELIGFAGERFIALDPEDRAEDPDATASLRESDHASCVLLHPGEWVVADSSGGFSALSDDEFRARYEPADEQPAVPAHPTETTFRIEVYDGDLWLPVGYPRSTLDEAREVRDLRRVKNSGACYRIVEWTASARVVETDDVPADAAAVTA